MKSISVMR